MHSVSQIVFSFFFNFLLIIIFSATGKLFYYVKFRQAATKEWFSFRHIFTGILFFTAVYAIIQSGGKTVLWPVLLLVPGYVALTRQEAFFSVPSGKTNAWLIAGCLVIYFLYYLQAFVSLDATQYRYADGDYLYYSRLVQYLNLGNPENPRVEYLYPHRFGVETYHWGDIWFGALLNRAGIDHHYVLLLSVSPILSALFALGLFQYSKMLYPAPAKKKYVIALAVLAALLSGFSFSYPHFIYEPYIFTESFAYYPKLMLVGCLLTAIVMDIRNGNWNSVFILFISGIIVFINVLPAFALTGAVLFLYLVFYKKVPFFSLLPALIAGTLTLGYLFLFYYQPSYKGTGLIGTESEPFSMISRLKLIGFSALKALLQFCRFVPYLLLFILAVPWKKEGGVIAVVKKAPMDVVLLLLLLLTGVIAYGLVAPVSIDAMQSFQNLYMPATSVLLVIGMVYILFSQRFLPVRLPIAIGILVLNLAYNFKFDYQVNVVSKADFVKAKEFALPPSGGVMVNIGSHRMLQSKYAAHTVLNQPCGFMDYIYPVYENASLNIPYAAFTDVEPFQKEEVKAIVQWAPFTYYVDSAGRERQKEELMAVFIKQKKVQAISVAPDTTLPAFLLSGVGDSVKISNGWKLFKVRSPG